MIVLGAQHAQQASGGLSGWEQLGIVVAGSLIAAAIIGVYAWLRKPSYRVHVVDTRLFAQTRDFDPDATDDVPGYVLKALIEVTNTGDIPLDVVLTKLAVRMSDHPLDEPGEASLRHQIAPGQHHAFRSELPFDPGSFVSSLDRFGPDDVSVLFAIDYGRPLLWWLRRRITATLEAKFRYGFFSPPIADPRGILNDRYAETPRDRRVWPWST